MPDTTFEKAITEEIDIEAGNRKNTAETTARVGKMSKEEFLQKVMGDEFSTEKALLKLQNKLHNYETKYRMRSEVFYKLIVGTPLEDNPDFIAWAMCYRSYFRVLQTKFAIWEEKPYVIHSPEVSNRG
ncbi:hypothetical protein FJZ31_36930 [Candidatus Poribacteria bacterium]|nr:hypothetical protein [Candidatus Poribacteria bacterium]